MPSKYISSKNSKNYEGEVDDELFDDPHIFDVSRSKMDEDTDDSSDENNSDDESDDANDVNEISEGDDDNDDEETEEDTDEEENNDEENDDEINNDEEILKDGKTDDGNIKRHDTCLYKIKNNGESKILFDSRLDTIFEDETVVQTKKVVPPEERISRPILTKYERVRLLSDRRNQLIQGAKPMVKITDRISEKEIASLELKSKVIPLIIVRTMPNGNIEHWKLDELEIVN